MSRPKQDRQGYLVDRISHLKVTREFHAKYEAISQTLDACPKILERLSLRDVVVRIEDGRYLPRFVRLGNRPMIDFTHLDRLRNSITPETWKQINQVLARHAALQQLISGESLRMDTTAVEANIHYPTDSSLLWDCYLVLGRLIDGLREWDPNLVGTGRLQERTVKKYYRHITRKAARKGRRTATEVKRESHPDFSWGQRFRAGIEGTITYLKRCFGLARCLNEGWQHFVATVGAGIFVHNLMVFPRC